MVLDTTTILTIVGVGKALLTAAGVRIPFIDHPATGADVELSNMVDWLAKAKAGSIKVDDKDKELMAVIRDQLNAMTTAPAQPLTLPPAK